uniref:TetR family transcriptional regulator n=2 Tax=Candidatus Bipolaricaulota TaxID=67810 RepID=H5SC86_9BACT|nr:TetR family transcriptional regulator [uncultured Acetothermia bacterium]BAL59470.1 TetR family transcriptional regulator [Candidatus Acetothermum autotrophicum]
MTQIPERRLREKQKEERYAAILQAALSIFAAKGLQEATMDEIAQAAGLGKGTIYYYFASKDALIEELLCSLAEQYFQSLLEGTESIEDPLAIAERIVTNLLGHYQRQPELFQVIQMILAAPGGGPPRARQVFAEKHREWLARLKDETAELLAARGINVEVYVDFIGTYAHGLLFAAVAGRDIERLREESGRVLRAFLK